MAEPNSQSPTKATPPPPTMTCCLFENCKRCFRPAGSHCFSKRMQKTIRQKKLKFTVDNKAGHTLICHFHRQHLILEGKKNVSATNSNTATKRSVINAFPKKECDTDEDLNDKTNSTIKKTKPTVSVNFEQLSANALKRYKKFFKLQTKPGLNKSQIAEVISEHFSSIPVENEKEILTYFVYAVKTKRNRLDIGNRASSSTTED